MDKLFGGSPRTARIATPVFVALVLVAIVAGMVVYTRTALDVLALAVLVLAVVTLERTLGDWLAETVGDTFSSVVLAVGISLGLWQMLAGGGRATTYRFLETAGHHGYSTVYLQRILEPAARSTHAIAGASQSMSGRASAPRSPSALPAAVTAGATSGVLTTERAPAGQPDTPRPSALPRTNQRSGASANLRLVVPSVVESGARVVLAAAGREGAQLQDGAVEFMLNDRVVGTATIRPDGSAEIELTAPPAPGTYTIRARLRGARTGDASSTATLTVHPTGPDVQRR